MSTEFHRAVEENRPIKHWFTMDEADRLEDIYINAIEENKEINPENVDISVGRLLDIVYELGINALVNGNVNIVFDSDKKEWYYE